MNRKVMINISLIIAVFIILGALFCLFERFMTSAMYWDADVSKQETIGHAYVKFCVETKRFPTNLLELVNTGYLPRESPVYLDPGAWFVHSVGVENSCYMVTPPPSNNVDNFGMIYRISSDPMKPRTLYTSIVGSEIRDEIHKQAQRDTNVFNIFIAPFRKPPR
jgi:hypothetical protein